MNMYIAILRGINVGGNRKLPMADLRSIMDNSRFMNGDLSCNFVQEEVSINII